MSFSLNCLIHGEVQEKMFTVEIEKTKNVSILKKLIKEENAPHLDHFAPSDLDLWIVNRPLDELGADSVPLYVINLNSYIKLSPPHEKLSSFFDHVVDDKRLHIIANTPGTSLQPLSRNFL
jgi:hypothetical protein